MANRVSKTRSSEPRAQESEPAARAGFSVVEMLIAVVVTGVAGAAVVGIFVEQSGFYEENSRRVMAHKSLRATADRMSTELRMVRQGDVLTAEGDRVTVRYGVTRGVVCHTSSGTAYVYLFRLPGSTAPDEMRYLEPRFSGTWQDPSLPWGDLDVDSNETCADHGAPSGAAAGRYREITSFTSLPEPGSLIYGTINLTYEFSEEDGRVALFRNGRRQTAPFEDSQSYFRYFREDGTDLTAPVSAGDRDDIAYLRVDATARGHDPNERFQGDRTMSLRIPFRN